MGAGCSVNVRVGGKSGLARGDRGTREPPVYQGFDTAPAAAGETGPRQVSPDMGRFSRPCRDAFLCSCVPGISVVPPCIPANFF